MIKKIKSSLTAKVFLITMLMLFCTALLIYGLLAWLMPQTYSNRLNDVLDHRTQNFIDELEKTALSESGGLFEQFTQNTEIDSVELYNENGSPIPLPSIETCDAGAEAISQEYYTAYAPILSNSYYFSFSDSSERYMLIVYGTAEQIAQLQQSFLQIFPLLVLIVFMISFIVSMLYSRIITKPVLEISHISEQMSTLHLEWQVDIHRCDELGILGRNLNTLSRSLSATLTDLQNANKKLESDIEYERQMEQARTDFFSAVSHELKTPITIMKGQLEGMVLNIGAYKDHKKYLSRALQVANTLESMVQEILTISRLETASTDFHKDRIDCVQMIKSYLDEMEDPITKKEQQVQTELPPAAFINGSRMLMEKVFSNLIGNAIIYSPRGASILIDVNIKYDHLIFSVENSGTHIPDSHIPKLFDAFYRVDKSRNRETGGTGLGLYIVQKILLLYDSECSVCNTSSGVKFSFIISI